MTIDQMIEVLQAAKSGKVIQHKDAWNDWRTCTPLTPNEFLFYGNNEYRVAPEPRKPREWTLYFYNGYLTHICPTTLNYETIRVREVIEEDKKSTVQRMMEHATGFKND